MPPYDYDLVVIGAGPAGEKGAAQAAYFGKRVAIVDRRPQVGGVSAHLGTLPSKTLRETALFLSGYRQRELYGVELTLQRHISISDFMARKGPVILDEVRRMEANLERHGITTVHGHARFVDEHTVRVSPVAGCPEPPGSLTAEVFLVATGSSPHRPEFVPFENIDVDDSDELLEMDRLPRSMAILGAGVIGCEYACMLAALGTQVTLIEGRAQLLPFLDHDLSAALAESMARIGVTTIFEDEATAVEPLPDRGVRLVLKSGRVIAVDRLLYTTGRVSNTGDLGLDHIGVVPGPRGRLEVDADYRTTCPSVYAAGDVIGFPALASTSMEQARVAVCHAFGIRYKRAVASVIPYGLYTIPEISTIGQSEAEAKKAGIDVEIGVARYEQNARGRIVGDKDGFVKLVFEAPTRRLLGAHVFGERATELVHVAQPLLHFEGTIDYFIDAVFNYPTLSETFKYAAYDGLGRLQRRRTRPPSPA